MKVRTGFVSNSSSCSFTIRKEKLTPLQEAFVRQVVNGRLDSKILKEYVKQDCLYSDYKKDVETYWTRYAVNATEDFSIWSCYEKENVFDFSTSMTNFDLIFYFELSGIEKEHMDISDY